MEWPQPHGANESDRFGVTNFSFSSLCGRRPVFSLLQCAIPSRDNSRRLFWYEPRIIFISHPSKRSRVRAGNKQRVKTLRDQTLFPPKFASPRTKGDVRERECTAPTHSPLGPPQPQTHKRYQITIKYSLPVSSTYFKLCLASIPNQQQIHLTFFPLRSHE